MSDKIPRLFYWEDAVDCWCPAPDVFANIIPVEHLQPDEETEIRVKRFDMTDEEFALLPEV